MIIEWHIQKKQGNRYPVLTYSAQWEEWEESLCPERVSVQVEIPTIGKIYKRGENAFKRGTTQLTLTLPTKHPQELQLPWGPETKLRYPTIKEGFLTLREAAEKAIRNALASEEWEESGELRTSPEQKKFVAPYVVAWRMLKGSGQEIDY